VELPFENIILLITAISLGIGLISWFRNFQESLARDKRIEPLVEKEKKAKEERRKKLELDAPRIPLYFDYENLDSLYSQSQMRKSSMRMDTIKKVTTFGTSQELDGKIASVGTTKTESEERILKEYETRENTYETVLKWLCDKDWIITGLEEPNDADTIIEDLESAYILAERSKEVPKEIKEAMTKVLNWKEKKKLAEIEAVLNKLILVKGDFLVKEYSERQFQILLDSNMKFHVYGLNDNCTKTGKDTFVKGALIKAGVFGYVSDLDKETYTLIIKPIAIHHLTF